MTVSVLRTADGWWVKTARRRRADRHRCDHHRRVAGRPDADRGRCRRQGTASPSTLSKLISPVTRPCRVVAQMTNFESHVKDAGMDPGSVPLTFFRKASASINGPFDDIVKPEHVRLLDYEVEIGLVIGRAIPVGTAISDANLAEFIAGLVVTNDVSARDIQLPQTQFYEAKSYPTFTPVGPELVLLDADELQAVRRSAAAPERQRRGAAERTRRGRHAVPTAAGAAVAHPIPGTGRRRPDAHRHPGRHRAERPAEAGADDRQPVAAGRQVEERSSRARPATPDICKTATSSRRRWPPTTAPSTSEPSASQSDTRDSARVPS